jgi:hypothetical protein
MTKDQVKDKFKNGMIPNENDFSDLIDALASSEFATGCVNHGSDAYVARPIGFAQILWIGTADPVNKQINDIWIDLNAF